MNEAEQLLVERWETLAATMAQEDAQSVLTELAECAPFGWRPEHPNPLIRSLTFVAPFGDTGPVSPLTMAALSQVWFAQWHFTLGLPPSVVAVYGRNPTTNTTGWRCEDCAYLVPARYLPPCPGERVSDVSTLSSPYLRTCPLCGGCVAFDGWQKKQGEAVWQAKQAAGEQLSEVLLSILCPSSRRDST